MAGAGSASLSTGWKSPQVATDLLIGDKTWNDLDNIKDLTSLYAANILGSRDDTTQFSATKYGFVTSGAITGMAVRWVHRCERANQHRDLIVQLWKGAAVGDNLADIATFHPTTFASFQLGGPGAMWSLPATTPAEVNDDNFGALFQIRDENSGADDAYIKSVEMNVWYEP